MKKQKSSDGIVAPVEKVKKPKKKAIWRRKYIHEVTQENDIKFHSPLSYRYFRIFGWIFLAVAQVGVILSFGCSLYKNPQLYGQWPTILSFFSSLMAPLFLIAAFSQVITAKNGYKKLILMYGGLSVLLFLVFLLVYEHYIVGTVKVINPEDAHGVVNMLFTVLSGHGFLAFNIFIDLLLCTLVTYFINYHPKKYFQGKLMYLFRSFAILPIAYEAGSITAKVLASLGKIVLHPLISPLLTTKAPLAFLIFVFMALFIKSGERFYIKKGKTHEDYEKFKDTNVNSLHFSLFLSGIIIFVGIIDIILMLGLTYSVIKPYIQPGLTNDQMLFLFTSGLKTVNSWGIGKTSIMILIVPLVLLFDYKKTHKNKMIDTLIPVAGIALIVIIYIEVGYEVLKFYIADMIKAPENPEESKPAQLVVRAAHKIKDFFQKNKQL